MRVSAAPSQPADASALVALVDAAAGILAADSLPDTLGRIAHHLGRLVAYDELSVYEVDRAGTTLVPVFALGAYAEEVMADAFPVTEGVTGWVVTNRRTRNVERSDHDPMVAVVAGTEMEPESLVSVPLLVEDRVVGALNVYRIGEDKQFSDAEVAQVERFATMAALAFDSARQRDSLREQARTDGLTGLLNHRACHERLRDEIATAATLERPLAVVALDLDHFKAINDAYGHGEGDKVLVAVAERLRGAVREDDVVARLGGEEFALILPGVDAAQGREAAERARAAIAEVSVAGKPLSCSAGVAAFPDDEHDPARLLELADGALYWAKRSGRGQSRRYDRRLAGQLTDAGQRAEVEALLAREDAIAPVFQPILELATGRVAGYEALARMPAAPLRRPDQWFDQAHRCGLGPALEAAALRAALRTPGRPAHTFIAVNVSPAGLLTAEVQAALPADLRGVVIELTEHDLFSSDSALDRELAELRRRGARIALDDTGNGYAGLKQVIRVAPDVLKLDRSLVDGIHADPVRFALLEALISFAATSFAAVCAEGVETVEDLAVLAQMDVTYAQGWALGRPAEAWPDVAADAAAAGSTDVQAGMRVPRAVGRGPTLGRLAGELAGVSTTEEMARVATDIAPVTGADECAVSRLLPSGDRLQDISRHDWTYAGTECALRDFPATEHVLRTRTPGQVVAGDPMSDPAEVALLRAAGFETVLMVPLVFGGRDVGLLELYRRRAVPFSVSEVDRALLIAHQLGGVLDLLERTGAIAS
jgi:diguanylate cyclase (GGDEF)-like protein